MSVVIPVKLPHTAYEVTIGAGMLDCLGSLMGDRAGISNKKVLLVSNPIIFDHYGARAIASMAAAGYDVETCILPAGEQHKHLGSIQQVYDAAIAHRLERKSTMVALGGGVIGDMTGFAAATWLRGISFVQVPTSLLAMVDASIGGKTGVNHPQGKNLIGAFYQPKLVLIDPDVLETLPVRELRAGMAEVIKYGVIWDPELFDMLEQAERLDEFAAVRPMLTEILRRSCQAKVEVVSQDEKESGIRAILNYGHTIAHAVESLTGYGKVNHGEAVGIGMVAAGAIARELDWWDGANCPRQDDIIAKTKLPTKLPSKLTDLDKIIDVLSLDKKVEDGKVRFILPQEIGKVEITSDVPKSALRTVLQEMAN
ncbi:MAG: 3-dehydroquinate synthase [Cyanobacteria bacterium P01_F01_bin.153]